MDLRARRAFCEVLFPLVGEGLGEGKPAKGRAIMPVIFGTALRPLDSVIDKVASVRLSLVALRPLDSIACHFGLNIKGISGLRSIVPYRLLIFSSQLVFGANVLDIFPRTTGATARLQYAAAPSDHNRKKRFQWLMRLLRPLSPCINPKKRPRAVLNAPARRGSANGKRQRPLPPQITNLHLPNH